MTTILAVRRNGRVALGGDGQVSMGETIAKSNANKVRTLRGGKLLAGFAGAAADGVVKRGSTLGEDTPPEGQPRLRIR